MRNTIMQEGKDVQKKKEHRKKHNCTIYKTQ